MKANILTVILRMYILVLLVIMSHNMMACGGNGNALLVDPDLTADDADFDGDGIINSLDDDDDNDGVLDVDDAFPFDPTESSDLDGDGLGDSADDDADGDGATADLDCDDLDANSYPEAEDLPDDDFTDSNCDGVDGDADAGIWVSTDEGNNSNDGTLLEPVKTITKAISLAKAKPEDERNVYVVAGNYDEDVTLTNNVNLYGGYSLLEDNTRTRNFDDNRAIINGIDSDKNTTITFHEGPVVMDYTLFINNTNSVIDGLVIYGDTAGICTIILNADATLTNNDIYDEGPSVTREFSITVATLIDSATDDDHTARLENNRIFMKGTNGLSSGSGTYANIGILAYPAMNADTTLNLDIINNEFDAEGITNETFAVLGADDDDNPNDDAVGDSKADINLNIDGNRIDLHGFYEAAYGILAGSNQLGNFSGPSTDDLNYISSVNVTNNTFMFDLNGSEGSVGTSVVLARDEVTIANNLFQFEGLASMIYSIFSIQNNIEVVHNTIYADVVSSQLMGLSLWAADNWGGGSINYVDNRPGRVNNNIIDLNHTSTNPSCAASGIVEHINTINDSYVNAASPSEIKNNDIHITTTCSNKFYYIDADSTTTYNYVTTHAQLNHKTYFRADDPSEIENNIVEDPEFNNASEGDFTLAEASPCLDTGIELDDFLTDIAGTARPQGDGVDMGAYEQ